MRATVDRTAFAAAVKAVAGAAGKPNREECNTAQRNLRLSVEGDALTLLAYDGLRLQIEAALGVTKGDAGSVFVPAKLLGQIAEHLQGETVVLSSAEDKPDLLLETDERTKITLTGHSGDDFKTLPFPEEEPVRIELTRAALRGLLSVRVATSDDETRPTLCGILLEAAGGGLRAVATDTHRLAVRTEPAEVSGAFRDLTVIHRQVVTRLDELLKGDAEAPVVLEARPGILRCSGLGATGNVFLTTRLIEGSFPGWRKAVPESHERRLTVDAKGLCRRLTALLVVARENGDCVSFTHQDGTLALACDAHETGSMEQSMPATLEGDGFETAFNGRYIQQGLAFLGGGQVHIEGSGILGAYTLRPADGANAYYVLMSMRR